MSRNARRKKQRTPSNPVFAKIESESHDGRGVARINEKAVFIDGALSGEEVEFRYRALHRHYDEGYAEKIIQASDYRVEPICAHYGTCGGCSLQHLHVDQQIVLKQKTLLDSLRNIGKINTVSMLPPITGPTRGYRRKARLGVKYVAKKGKVLVGFREKRNRFLADINSCPILHPMVGERIETLAELIQSLDCYNQVAQLEVAVSDDRTAIVLRNLIPVTATDKQKLLEFSAQTGIQIYLQPGGVESIYALTTIDKQLSYSLDNYGLRLAFEPTDFTQVNYPINQKMVLQAIDLLNIENKDTLLDLFCGIGNFTLALAKQSAFVVAVEGDDKLIETAKINATQNSINNVAFFVDDLFKPLSNTQWAEHSFTKALIDPPRSGAKEVLPILAKKNISRIVYVSCNPSTLARDAALLTREYGYRLESAGILDMFPHTSHVESMALFVRI